MTVTGSNVGRDRLTSHRSGAAVRAAVGGKESGAYRQSVPDPFCRPTPSAAANSILAQTTTIPFDRPTSIIGDQPAAGVQSPIVVPSGSANQAKVPDGIVTGGTSVLPPRDSALAR